MEEAAIGLGITHAALGAYLEDVIEEFAALGAVTKFGDGQSNPTYKLEAGSGTYVLRSKPPGALLPSAHAVDREFQVMQALAATDVPVPEMLYLAMDSVSPSGRAFFVMRFMKGNVFWNPALPEVDLSSRQAMYDAMNAALATLHDVNIDAVGLSDYGKPGNYFARQLDRWSKQYLACVETPDKMMIGIMEWLATHMPQDDGQVSLVHGDWRLDNMMFKADSTEIEGVLDWELSTLGHPMADLAYQCMQWRLPNQGNMRGLAGLDRGALGIPTEEEYVAAYAARRGIDDVTDWPFYLVFAFFRLASILAGVAARARAGNASNPKTAALYAQAVPALAMMATEVMRDGA